MTDFTETMARAHYEELTRLVAEKIPGSPFKKWETLDAWQRMVQRSAMRAAIVAAAEAVKVQASMSHDVPVRNGT
jgi:hypothetical protein